MRVARGKRSYISALNAELDDGPFRCPECKLEVILKKGDIYTHHFAHHPGEGCAYGEIEGEGEWSGESALHQLAKKEIREALSHHKEVTDLKLERFLDSVRPDISCYFAGIPIAIETQVSAIRTDVIVRRTVEYARRGVFILWVSPLGETMIRDGQGYNMRDWERYIHEIYRGTFYYWTEGETLLPVHFQNRTTQESTYHLSVGLQVPHIGEPVCIADLERASIPLKLPGERIYRETKLWCIPEMWGSREGCYLPIAEAKKLYPSLFPEVRGYPPVDDPFHAENAPSDFALRGFVAETEPELMPLFSQFYAKYGASSQEVFWIGIDETPNRFYFAPDWWQRFRLEYLEANTYTKARLVEILEEKLSGEKASKSVLWPAQRVSRDD